MALWEMDDERLAPVDRTTFHAASVWERRDLQRLIRDNIDVLGRDLMVIAEEFGNWVHSDVRIDLLCVDRDANLVVVELKRDDRGGHAELQALRYAALMAPATFDQIVDAHVAYRRRRAIDSDEEPFTSGEASAAILDFLGWDEPDDERFASDVRIILASSDFSVPLTSAVLWLRGRGGIDIRCVRLIPYSLDGRLLLEVEQTVPLPEAADLTDRIADKDERRREARSASARDLRRFDIEVVDRSYDRLPKNRAAFEVVSAAVRDLGVPARGILEGTVEGRRRRYRPRLFSLPGTLSEAEVAERLLREYPAYQDRYYTDGADLLHQGGETWLVSTQWSGQQAESFIQELAGRYPDLRLRLSVSA